MKKYLLIFSIFILCLDRAVAGFVFEPSIGIRKGIWSTKREGSNYLLNMKGDSYGLQLGGRLFYYHTIVGMKWFLGGDYNWAALMASYNKSDGASDLAWEDSVTGINSYISGIFGFVVGKIQMAMWFGFVFSSDFEYKKYFDPGLSNPSYSGKGTKFGLSFPSFSKELRTIVEYTTFAFDEVTIGGSTTALPGNTAGGTLQEKELSTLSLSISYPFGGGK